MSRRGSPAVQILVVVVVVLFFLYGFYSYHEQHTRLKLCEEKNEKNKQKSESLSARLQVLYEHKGRLENAVQEEKKLHKETKESLELKIKELQNEQNLLTKEKESVEARLQKEFDDNKMMLEKVQNDLNKEITRLRGDVADFKGRYEECEAKTLSRRGDPQQNRPMAQPVNADQKVQSSDHGLQMKQPDGDQLQPEVLPQNNVQAVGDTKGNGVDVYKNFAAADSSLQRDSVAAQAVGADLHGGDSQKDKQQASDLNQAAAVLDQSQQSENQIVDQHQVKVVQDKVDLGVQNSQQVNEGNVNKVAGKDDDYAGDVEKPQQQQKQDNAVVDQVAKPVANADGREEEVEKSQGEGAKDKDGAGL